MQSKRHKRRQRQQKKDVRSRFFEQNFPNYLIFFNWFLFSFYSLHLDRNIQFYYHLVITKVLDFNRSPKLVPLASFSLIKLPGLHRHWQVFIQVCSRHWLDNWQKWCKLDSIIPNSKSLELSERLFSPLTDMIVFWCCFYLLVSKCSTPVRNAKLPEFPRITT